MPALVQKRAIRSLCEGSITYLRFRGVPVRVDDLQHERKAIDQRRTAAAMRTKATHSSVVRGAVGGRRDGDGDGKKVLNTDDKTENNARNSERRGNGEQ